MTTEDQRRGYTRAVSDVPKPVRWDASAPTRIRLDPALAGESSVVEHLNHSGNRVAAQIHRGELVIQPVGPTLVAGMPAFWTWRPSFRGVLESPGDGLVLRGSVRSSEASPIALVAGVAVAVMGASAGAFIVLSGDVTGFPAIGFSLIVGAGLIAGATFIRRLSSIDEQTIMAALKAISDEPAGTSLSRAER
jgi:hypothetical protein